jgi:hypothetical protein
MKLSEEERRALQSVLKVRPEVRRALYVERGERPTVAFEYDDRPTDVEAAQSMIQDLVTAGAPVLGELASECGFSAGGPEEIALLASGGDVIYERE